MAQNGTVIVTTDDGTITDEKASVILNEIANMITARYKNDPRITAGTGVAVTYAAESITITLT